MATFGKLAASAVTGSVENTLALVNLNFDFSLVKLEAPKEFEGVGSALSPLRRSEAEEGRTHATARKLAALFEQHLPQTPKLLKAYGQRASEISQSPLAKPTDIKTARLFAQHAGADGTSLWAAATSGHNAVKVHLLACYLARIWSHPEATSIWVEFVTERKKRIVSNFVESGTITSSTYLAAKQDITRAQLAEWDSSARAWLRTADAFKKKQQIQLDLILKNIAMVVNCRPGVYDSVLQAWTTALRGMENLIAGMPQKAQSAEILLGLSAWHLYPNLLVLDTKNISVEQRDPLVSQAGILTIRFQHMPSTEEEGIKWSLPLAHMKYYGEPVLASRHLSMDGSRLSIEEFFQAVLGAVIGYLLQSLHGALAVRLDLETVHNLAELFIELSSAICDFYPSDDQSWFGFLAESSHLFLKSEGNQRQRYLNLINLGNRHAHDFLPSSGSIQPIWGLTTVETVYNLCETIEDDISFLRWLAKEVMGVKSEDVIIRYQRGCDKCCSSENLKYEYATAVPLPRSSLKRTADGKTSRILGHTRWIYPTTPLNPGPTSGGDTTSSTCTPDSGEYPSDTSSPSEYTETSSEFDFQADSPMQCSRGCHEPYYPRTSHPSDPEEVIALSGPPSIALTSADTIRYEDMPSEVRQILGYHYMDTFYRIAAGKVHRTALFLKQTRRESIRETPTMSETTRYFCRGISFLVDLLKSRRGNATTSVKLVEILIRDLNLDFVHCMKGLASIARLYKSLPWATVSVTVLRIPLLNTHWLFSFRSTIVNLFREEIDPYKLGFNTKDETTLKLPKIIGGVLSPLPMDREHAFACICIMESGKPEFNLPVSQLSHVMAISAGDSIYVYSPLVSDPYDRSKKHEIVRIVGNVGKPQLCLLTAPADLRLPEEYTNRWDVINHFEFDGVMRDCFSGTSLHLEFTGWEQPVDIMSYGARDSELLYVECVISVLDQGNWIADIDILGTSDEQREYLECVHHSTKGCCNSEGECAAEDISGHGEESAAVAEGKAGLLTTVQNWPEFFERPNGSIIFLSQGNWQARLAAASMVEATKKARVVVCSKKMCKLCVLDYHKQSLRKRSTQLLIC
ncbi:hypothetical protein ABW21_db0207196 [Orbilia brochopaga]|nr:hypothetical protein ABW21_db0207196 [Drechslerella brochopaga]